MDLWNWDEASPQEVPPGNRLSGPEGAELGFYFHELALQGNTLTEETSWKGLPQRDWSSASPHPEAPWVAEHTSRALPWSGDCTHLACTRSEAWSSDSPALGPAPPSLNPAPFAGSNGVEGQNYTTSWKGANWCCPRRLSHPLGLGAAYGLHHLFEGVPEFRYHQLLRTEPAVGPHNFGSLLQN
uniref:Uncharacterized protein n=1 Tax=Rousettus aegyptiacus TaxID=9407 RepID=A0A7J8CHZ0_ROUAE|nr:hypothetical protein HJG63_009042 [Rousettus aegyptiacus]